MGEEFNTTGNCGEEPVCSQPSGLAGEGIRAARDEETDTEITVVDADGGGEKDLRMQSVGAKSPYLLMAWRCKDYRIGLVLEKLCVVKVSNSLMV